MSKSSKQQIKEDEQKILNELKINSNKSINKIAKICGFSRQKVWRIIKELENKHTIWGYPAIVNEEKRGLTNFIVLIKRTPKPINKELIDLIISRKLEELTPKTRVIIETTMYTHGEYDWVICFQATDIKAAKLFCEVLNTTYHGHIAEIKLVQVLFPIRVQGILNPEIEKLHQFL